MVGDAGAALLGECAAGGPGPGGEVGVGGVGLDVPAGSNRFGLTQSGGQRLNGLGCSWLAELIGDRGLAVEFGGQDRAGHVKPDLAVGSGGLGAADARVIDAGRACGKQHGAVRVDL
ncbi:MAG: hypothetical protein M3R02_23935 [Chloroflexota bacterium]|nr:hypothetical protein [Chloroflexota bacterium]